MFPSSNCTELFGFIGFQVNVKFLVYVVILLRSPTVNVCGSLDKQYIQKDPFMQADILISTKKHYSTYNFTFVAL